MVDYCPHCQEDQAVTVVTRNETYPVYGEPITVTACVAVCSTCRLWPSMMPRSRRLMRCIVSVMGSHTAHSDLSHAPALVPCRWVSPRAYRARLASCHVDVILNNKGVSCRW